MTSLRGKKRNEFPQEVRKAAFRRCCGKDGIPKCEGCGNPLRAGGIFYEHMDPDGLGGEPTLENCQVRCGACKRAKDKTDNAIMAKADRVLRKTFGLTPSKKKIQSRGFAKSSPQHTASRPIRKGTDYVRD